MFGLPWFLVMWLAVSAVLSAGFLWTVLDMWLAHRREKRACRDLRLLMRMRDTRQTPPGTDEEMNA